MFGESRSCIHWFPFGFWNDSILLVEQKLNLQFRFGLEFGYTKPPCGDFETPQPPEWWFKVFPEHFFQHLDISRYIKKVCLRQNPSKVVDQIHYLHFGLLLWGISGIVTVRWIADNIKGKCWSVEKLLQIGVTLESWSLKNFCRLESRWKVEA